LFDVADRNAWGAAEALAKKHEKNRASPVAVLGPVC